jgi:2-hydroxyacyl-CoA lyase 1
VVGIPVVPTGFAFSLIDGMRFVGFRNEQAATYAANASAYLTGKPGVCLCVPGPGVVHSLVSSFVPPHQRTHCIG